MSILQIYLTGIPMFMIFMVVLRLSDPLFRDEFVRVDAETQRTALLALGFMYFMMSLVWFISFFVQSYEMLARFHRTGSIHKSDDL